MFIFRRIFWGMLLILLGIGLFIERVYGINLPLWGIFWSLVVIVIGINLILPRERRRINWQENYGGNTKNGDVIFDEAKIEGEDRVGNYNVVFGRGDIDLTKLKKPTKDCQMEINTVFGKATIKIKKDLPVRIKTTSAFGEARLPKGNSVAFGDTYYESSSFDSKKPYILIRANAVFGSLEIIEE